jgi:drug/metabolite transporter (DMT)-like permease
MAQTTDKSASPVLVIIAFATVYIVWGSTYFFIQMGLHGLPPMLLGALRFLTAGMLMMVWCIIKGEKIFIKNSIITSAIVGLLLLGGGNGVVIWVEQKLPSAMVAILVSSAPIWFVLLDKQNWATNLRNRATVAGLIIGFAGVILLFGEQLGGIFAGGSVNSKLPGMILLILGSIAWSSGSLYSKHHPSEGSAAVNVAWQMIIAGLVFLPGSLLNHEFDHLQWQQIPMHSWLALGYLIIFGSIAAFSAYVWLLQVRPATQVSTYAYVNPVIAVILGMLFAHEHVSLMQIAGLVTILGSVLLINLSKYRKEKTEKQEQHNEVAAEEVAVANNASLEECTD